MLFAAGSALRLWPVFVLGDRFSGLVAIQPGHRLVTSGIYSVIRNPSYLGLLVNSLGWAPAFRSGVGVLLTALLSRPRRANRVGGTPVARAFGAEYDAYCRRTWRLIPGLLTARSAIAGRMSPSPDKQKARQCRSGNAGLFSICPNCPGSS
ncbi:MAG: isoprenylcysteine carboxylmethyltransferase family protein [Mesorhizobium sp.]